MALRVLGYTPGTDPNIVDDRTKAALSQYRESKGLPATEFGIRLAIAYLGLDLSNRSRDPEVIRLSIRLMDFFSNSDEPRQQVPSTSIGHSGSGCDDGHWVAKVMANGEFVKLEDGSLWQIDSLDRIDTMLWLPTEDIIVCGNRLINTDNGEKVGATQIR